METILHTALPLIIIMIGASSAYFALQRPVRGISRYSALAGAIIATVVGIAIVLHASQCAIIIGVAVGLAATLTSALTRRYSQ